MSLSRRRFIKSSLAGSLGLSLGPTLSLLPGVAYSDESETLTLAFGGTATTRDEGEVSREDSDISIYLPEAGYIPVRINKELGGNTSPNGTSDIGQTIRGVGENDWAEPRDDSEPLIVTSEFLSPPDSLISLAEGFSGGDQYSKTQQASGTSMGALALHGANLAANAINDGAKCINLIGHSRGACQSIMMAWFLYAYGDEAIKEIPVNIFAIDPVPGAGNWYSILTQLPPNVEKYVGVYSWDHLDTFFQGVVPRPNGLMRGESNYIEIHDPTWFEKLVGTEWKNIANDIQQQDPLIPADASSGDLTSQPSGYELYACRGRHSTVSGNTTIDGAYVAGTANDSVAPVPALIYKMARGYLTQWGTQFETPCAISEGVHSLRVKIHRDHMRFDNMGGGPYRNSSLPNRPYVRRVSSIHGRNPVNTYYMDNVVGDPPYKLMYPVTQDRTNTGWVNWKFL